MPIRRLVARCRGRRLGSAAAHDKANDSAKIRRLCRSALARNPSKAELDAALTRLAEARSDQDLIGVADFLWAMALQIEDGDASQAEVKQLEMLCDMVKHTSLCGLGQSAPNPVISTLRYFRPEYEALLTRTPGNSNGKVSLPLVPRGS